MDLMAILTSRSTWLRFGFLLPASLPFAAAAHSPVAETEVPLDWFSLLMGLFGGLALFLFGMEQLSAGLKAVAGNGLRLILTRLTANRFLGALTGAFVTAVLNSSSVTTVLVVGFVTAGLMSLPQAIGVIMGANIGSTFTAQIIAFKVTRYALLLVAAGFALLFLSKKDRGRQFGAMLMGLGLLFFGMGVMSGAMSPLRSYQPFLDLMVHMQQPLLGIMVGAVFTGLVQSSAATTGIAIVMASEGLVALPTGIALVFGANIGTCVTALLAAIGKPAGAVRAAVVHILFNVAGVLLWVGLIPQLVQLTTLVSPASPALQGTARMAAEVPRQIANAHTIFNVVNTLIFIGLSGVFARFVEWLVPDIPKAERALIKPKFLDEELLRAPSMALERVRFEIGHLGELALEMLGNVRNVMLLQDREKLDAIARMDDQLDNLHGEIVRYMGKIRRHSLSDKESHVFVGLLGAAANLESIGDVIETDFVDLGEKVIQGQIQASETMTKLLTGLHRAVASAVECAVLAVRKNEKTAAEEVLAMKDRIQELVDEALLHQADRLGEKDPKRLAIFRVEMDAVDKLKRIYTLAKRIARVQVPAKV